MQELGRSIAESVSPRRGMSHVGAVLRACHVTSYCPVLCDAASQRIASHRIVLRLDTFFTLMNKSNTQQTTNNQQPTTNNQQPTTNNKQQTTNNKQQTTNNKQQTTNNKQQTTNNTTHNTQHTTNNKQQTKPPNPEPPKP